MCVRLTSVTFPVIWSSVLISVIREWRYRGLVYKFFLTNNRVKVFVWLVPKISQVMIKWRRQASHLGRFTMWPNGCRATQLGRFTLWHNGRWATQLGKFALWPGNSSRATQLSRYTLWHKGSRTKPGLMHVPVIFAHIFQDSDEPCWKIWRLNPK